MATGVIEADAIHTALQPLNVQMAILIEVIRAMKKPAASTGDDEDEPKKKRSAASWNDITRGIGASAVVLNQMNGLIASFGNQIGSLVSAFSPATFELFTRTVKDLHASFGEGLLPLFRAGTEAVRFLADSFAGMIPVVLPLVETLVSNLRPVLAVLGAAFRELLTAMIPIMKGFSEIQTQLFSALTPVLQAILPPLIVAITALQKFQLLVGQIFAAALGAVLPLVTIFAQTVLPILAAGLQMLGTAAKVLLAPLQVVAAVLGILFQVIAVPFKILGPILAAAATAVGEVVDLLGGLFTDVLKGVADLLKELFGAVVSLLQPVGDVLTRVIRGIVEAMVEAVKWFREMIVDIRAFLGLPAIEEASKPDFDGASRGKGANQASTTSVSEMLKQLDAAAFGAGKAAAPQETAKNTAATVGLLGDLKTLIANLPDKIAAALDSKLGQVASAVNPAAGVRTLFREVTGR